MTVTRGQIERWAGEAGARYPQLVGAQWQLESAGGTALAGRNNPFGIKGKGTVSQTTEVVNGKTISVNAGFQDFASQRDAVNHLVSQWYRDYKGYKGVNNAPTIQDAARQLREQGYATDPHYTGKLLKLTGSKGGGAPAGGATPANNWTRFSRGGVRADAGSPAPAPVASAAGVTPDDAALDPSGQWASIRTMLQRQSAALLDQPAPGSPGRMAGQALLNPNGMPRLLNFQDAAALVQAPSVASAAPARSAAPGRSGGLDSIVTALALLGA